MPARRSSASSSLSGGASSPHAGNASAMAKIAAGGPADIYARALAEKLGDSPLKDTLAQMGEAPQAARKNRPKPD